MKQYKGYELKRDDRNNRFYTFKARPYDDADYYWVYTNNEKKWYGVYKGKVEIEFNNRTFEEVIYQIDRLNQNIEPKMCNN